MNKQLELLKEYLFDYSEYRVDGVLTDDSNVKGTLTEWRKHLKNTILYAIFRWIKTDEKLATLFPVSVFIDLTDEIVKDIVSEIETIVGKGDN